MAADLKDTLLPDVDLPATGGGTINPARVKGYGVFVVYPWTGRPGHDTPEGWDEIPGAHGSTPQLLSYNKMLRQFLEVPSQVFAVSNLALSWQTEFVTRNGLSFSVLSDAQEQLSTALGLSWFKAGARQFLNRRTLIARDGCIVMDRQVIAHPEDDAGQTLALLRVLMKS